MSNDKTILPALSGFSHVKRYWDSAHSAVFAKIMPGELYVTKHDEGIYTILGSCIAVCMRDPTTGIGGMNHFMLPIKGNVLQEKNAPLNGDAARYGNWAMEYLINEIMKNGGKRRNLELKLFGGSSLIGSGTPVGERNVEFITSYVYDENLRVAAKDLGGPHSRAVIYFPKTGKVKCRALVEESKEVLASEQTYMKSFDRGLPKADDDIELF